MPCIDSDTDMIIRVTVFIAILLQALASAVQAETKSGWELSFFFGTSFSKDEDLTIRQDGQPDILLEDAQFSTKPFQAPPYYALRLGRWYDDVAWEIEHIHQKIYVETLPSAVQHFEITDGYNLFLLNVAWRMESLGIIARAGVGPVVAHPQITVRSLSNHKSGGGAIPTVWDSDSGYQWTGPALQLAIEKELPLTEHWIFSLEGKLSHAEADITIARGSVVVPNTALHLLFGMKYSFE